uniref:Integrase catalytic domain-containing protein n=1 Tax=Tanacetum cinerariifolium TaxID=118510 RepID=A0A6L2N561_TANCI|nr:hypothetical protein [Tanacetum cinerariifolium]
MTLDIHNWSSSVHQEFHKIVKHENFPIVKQVDARLQNFKIQFLKEAAKFVRDFKSLAKEADESLAKHKALELEIERLLRAVASRDIMSIVQRVNITARTRRPRPRSNTKNDSRLHLLHMDLYGLMRVKSINGKRYVLVIVDDYSRYMWVHFLRSKDEAPKVIKTFLKKIQVLLQALVIIVRTDNDTEFKNQKLQEYFNSVGISHQASSVRTPQQNRVVEQRNHTLVEAAETIKPGISVLHVFEALCYPKNDREDIGKHGAKGDIGFFIGYSANSCAYRVYNRRTKKIIETMNVTFDELLAMAFEQSTMYDDYIGGQPSAATRTILAAQAPQVLQTLMATTTTSDTTPTPKTSSSQATNIPNTSPDVDELTTQQQHVQQQNNQAQLQPEIVANNVLNDMFDGNTFVNPFATPSTSAADHHLHNMWIHRTYGEMYMYALTMSTREPKNVKEAMTDPAWIESMRFDDDILVVMSMLMILSLVLQTLGFLDVDYAGCKDTFKSTSGGAQFLGEKLLTDYGFHFNKIPIYCDSISAIAISCNPVQHSRTKHIIVRYQEHVEKGTIELYFVKTDYQLADLFSIALLVDRFNYLVRRLGMRNLSPQELERLAKSRPTPTIEADRRTKDKTNKVETAKKPTVKYAKLYRRTSKSSKARGENGRACPKNNNTHKSMPPRAVVHKTVRSPTRTNRPNMNVAQPRRTNFPKTKHSYVRRPFQETIQDLMIILIQRVKMLENELKARTLPTKVHKVDRGRSRPVMAWVPKKITIGRLIDGAPYVGIDIVIKDLDLEPKIDTMMRDFLKKQDGDVVINTLTIEQYLTLTRKNQASSVVKPEIKGNGPIPNKTPDQALTAIQTMVDHSQKWHVRSTSRRVSNDNSVRIAAIINKMDILRRDMKNDEDLSGPEPPPELWRSLCVEGHIRSELGEQVWLGTIIGMIRGNTSKKRPQEQSEQWLDNEISFPFTPGYQLVDSLIILEALIEGFLELKQGQNLKSPERHWMEEAQGPALEKSITVSRIPIPDSEGKTSAGREESQGQTKEEREPEDTVQPPPNPPKKYIQKEEIEGKDEHPKRPIESKLPKKVTSTHMTGIPFVIAEHELKMYPHIEPRVQRKRSIAPEIRKVVKKEVEEWLKARIVRKSKSRKSKALINMLSPSNLKQMQRLSNKLAALKRFISKAAKKALPCLDTLKKCTNKKEFHWTTEAKEAFQEMNKLIAELPTLTTPKKEEELMVYISAVNEAVSAVLLVERHGRQALIHYVIIEKPISQIINNQEATGRLAKWGIKLEAYGIKYAPRSTIKGQVLADFLANTIAEDSFAQIKACGPNDALAEGKSKKEQEASETKTYENLGTEADVWKLYTDGASNEHGSGAGLILIDSEATNYSYAHRLNFANSNNDAEYEALLAEVNAIVEEITRTWMTPIQEYIEHGILPEDAAKA